MIILVIEDMIGNLEVYLTDMIIKYTYSHIGYNLKLTDLQAL
ncbi:hypothetical protein CM15mP35_05670 [bacterium]|nr:MAG: hypothetical protein CM15mP35_05670 [bacterium]